MRGRDLTPEEARWVARLRRTMAACPTSLHLLTIGSCYLDVIDAAMAEDTDLHDGRADEIGATLATVKCPVPVHGVSG